MLKRPSPATGTQTPRTAHGCSGDSTPAQSRTRQCVLDAGRSDGTIGSRERPHHVELCTKTGLKMAVFAIFTCQLKLTGGLFLFVIADSRALPKAAYRSSCEERPCVKSWTPQGRSSSLKARQAVTSCTEAAGRLAHVLLCSRQQRDGRVDAVTATGAAAGSYGRVAGL